MIRTKVKCTFYLIVIILLIDSFRLNAQKVKEQKVEEMDFTIGLNFTHLTYSSERNYYLNYNSISNQFGVSSGLFVNKKLVGFIGTFVSTEILLERFKLTSESFNYTMGVALSEKKYELENQSILLNLNLGFTFGLPEKLKSKLVIGVYIDYALIQLGPITETYTEIGYWSNTSSSLDYVQHDPPIIMVTENNNFLFGSLGYSFGWNYDFGKKIGFQPSYHYVFWNSELKTRNTRFELLVHYRLH